MPYTNDHYAQAYNGFDEAVKIEVELLSTKNSAFSQMQKFTPKIKDRSKAPLPFFYENDPSKDFVDQFSFKVTNSAGRTFNAAGKRCALSLKDFDSTTLVETVTVNSTGWAFGSPKTRCDGKWDKK